MKSLKKVLTNQQGLSLIEVIVAAAISVIVSGAVMKTNETGQKGMAKIKTDIDLQMWQSMELLPVLNSADSCMANVTNQLPSNAAYQTYDMSSDDTAFVIKRVERDNTSGVVNAFSSTIVAQAGKVIASGSWEIDSITRNQFQEDATDSVTGHCPIEINLTRSGGKKRSYGPQNKILRVNLRCRVKDRTNNYLEYCQAAGDNDSLWTLAHNHTPQYIARDGYVLIGGTDGDLTTRDDNIGAPFQVNIADSVEWPAAASGTGIYPAIKVGGDNKAITFPQNAIYQDSNNCLTTMSDSVDAGAAAATTSSRFCSGTVELGSLNVTMDGTSGKTNTSISGYDSSVAGSFNSVMSAYHSVVESSADLSAIIASSGSTGFESRISGDNSVVLGASNVTVSGQFSIASGSDNIVSSNHSSVIGNNNNQAGDSSFLVGTSLINKVDGDKTILFGNGIDNNFSQSIVGGNGTIASGSGSNNLIISSGSNVIDTNHAAVLGANNYVNCSYCLALGSDIDIRHSDSVVMGSWRGSSRALNSTNSRQFTAGFDNGFRFFTNNSSTSSAAAENGAVYFDPNGNVGIGKDIQNVPLSNFSGGAIPKLYVNGDAEVNGKLWVSGEEVNTSVADSWMSLPIASSHPQLGDCSLTPAQYYKDHRSGRVYFKGCIKMDTKTFVNPISLTTIPAAYRPVATNIMRKIFATYSEYKSNGLFEGSPTVYSKTEDAYWYFTTGSYNVLARGYTNTSTSQFTISTQGTAYVHLDGMSYKACDDYFNGTSWICKP